MNGRRDKSENTGRDRNSAQPFLQPASYMGFMCLFLFLLFLPYLALSLLEKKLLRTLLAGSPVVTLENKLQFGLGLVP